MAVIDSRYAGRDAGEVLDGRHYGIPVVGTVEEALEHAAAADAPARYFVIGIAPDGGKLPPAAKNYVKSAICAGLHIDSGLHDFMSEDAEIAALASEHGVQIRDIRKTPPRSSLHFFTGDIEKVDSLKIAVLGTDSAVGKRTTAWIIVHAMRQAGIPAELVGTGQTAWMQGARYSLVMDSLINDFVAGEIEHAVVSAWKSGARVIVIEGQGSLMNPAYPGGFEILAAGRPDIVVLQHAPMRQEYDGFPGYAMHPLDKQIAAIEMLSGKPVVAITVNHEDINREDVPGVCRKLTQEMGLPAFDVLLEGGEGLVAVLKKYLKN
jgi:uncharacterized NAD-dependent epimerase/dehydratase family protein